MISLSAFIIIEDLNFEQNVLVSISFSISLFNPVTIFTECNENKYVRSTCIKTYENTYVINSVFIVLLRRFIRVSPALLAIPQILSLAVIFIFPEFRFLSAIWGSFIVIVVVLIRFYCSFYSNVSIYISLYIKHGRVGAASSSIGFQSNMENRPDHIGYRIHVSLN